MFFAKYISRFSQIIADTKINNLTFCLQLTLTLGEKFINLFIPVLLFSE